MCCWVGVGSFPGVSFLLLCGAGRGEEQHRGSLKSVKWDRWARIRPRVTRRRRSQPHNWEWAGVMEPPVPDARQQITPEAHQHHECEMRDDTEYTAVILIICMGLIFYFIYRTSCSSYFGFAVDTNIFVLCRTIHCICSVTFLGVGLNLRLVWRSCKTETVLL